MATLTSFSDFKIARKAHGWFTTRFPRIVSIWTTIGLLLYVILRFWPNATLQVADSNLLSAETVKGIADPRLFVYLIAAWGAFQVLIRGGMSALNTDDEDRRKVDAYMDGLFDEISSAATHGGCVTVLALILEHCGLATAAPAPTISANVSVGLILLFFMGAIVTFDVGNTERLVSIKHRKFKIHFSNLKDGDRVLQIQTVGGSVSKPIPPDYELWGTRHWPEMEASNQFYPVMKARVFYVDREDWVGRVFCLKSHHWEMQDFFFGGEPNHPRILEMWLVGPSGKIVFETGARQGRMFNELRDSAKLPFNQWPTPALTAAPNDTVRRATLRVVRK